MQAPPIKQQPTRKYTPATARPVDLVVFHTIQCPENSSRAEWCSAYLRDSDRKASAHFYVDDDSIVQGVDVKNVAWAAPGGNRQGIQIEHAGYAEQTPAQWDDPYSRRMLDLSARLTAWLCTTYRIPILWVTAADLRKGARGITSHAEVSRAFKLSDHTDPGVNFPIARYLELVRKHAATQPGSAAPAAKPVATILKTGSKGARVTALQKTFNDKWLRPNRWRIITQDGDFGPDTERVVTAFQKSAGLAADGVVGPRTLSAIAKKWGVTI